MQLEKMVANAGADVAGRVRRVRGGQAARHGVLGRDGIGLLLERLLQLLCALLDLLLQVLIEQRIRNRDGSLTRNHAQSLDAVFGEEDGET